MIASHDHVGAAVILADDRVPQRLAGPAHTHGEVQQAQRGGLFGILLQNVLIAAHAGEVVDVARFGHADHRVNQQVRLGFAGGPKRQFLVGAVQGVAGLERDNPSPAELPEAPAQFRGAVTQ